MTDIKPGEVEIKLHQLGSQKDIGERLVTDGNTFTVYSPYRPEGEIVSRQMAEVILRQHADMSLADLAVVLMAPGR